VNKIICGDYIRENGLDMIQLTYGSRQRKISLAHASSGQQESLPILIILSTLSFVDQRLCLVIEEPEAHLFPEAQKYMVELMSLIFNITEKRNKLFITTHSPYLLTAFNHSIQAGNVLKAINDKPPEEAKKLQEELFKIMPHNQIIDIEDIGVYTLKDGKIKSIIEPENNLIDTNIIDEVSELFEEEFDELLDLESKVCQWH
ncbi:MAG: AAA family ATPase, partial [Cyanobacteria bacterium P01_F01_bin.143]